MRPTYLGIGAYKCGTTTLHHYLMQHPEVAEFPGKEACWFPAHGGCTQAAYETVLGCDYLYARGEISPIYQFRLQRINEVYPGIPLILCVREPVARFVSHVRAALIRGNPPDLDAIMPNAPGTYRDALSAGLARLMQMGDYRATILQARALGHPLLVLDFDRIANDQPAVWDDVCDFLGVRRWHLPERIHAWNGKHTWQPEPALVAGLRRFYEVSNRFMADRFGIRWAGGDDPFSLQHAHAL